jgi:hypothetical protein
VRGDVELATIEASQLGLSTRDQLRSIGISGKALRHRRASGRIEYLGHDVFRNPSATRTFEQDVLSAVLRGGKTAFASHATAARLWAVSTSLEGMLEVSTILERQPRIAGVRMHRSGLLLDADVRTLSVIPVSSPARTLVDLSGRLSHEQLGRLVDEALRRRLVSLGQLLSVMERLGPAPGRSPKRLAAVVNRRTPGTESTLEDFVIDAIRRYALPAPTLQHRVVVGGVERRIDVCYPESFVAIEALGFEYHGLRSRFDDDALRGNELQLAGFRVLEFTSEFDDWTIASHVARALDLPVPPRKSRRTYDQWRLCRDRPERGSFGTNSG